VGLAIGRVCSRLDLARRHGKHFSSDVQRSLECKECRTVKDLRFASCHLRGWRQIHRRSGTHSGFRNRLRPDSLLGRISHQRTVRFPSRPAIQHGRGVRKAYRSAAVFPTDWDRRATGGVITTKRPTALRARIRRREINRKPNANRTFDRCLISVRPVRLMSIVPWLSQQSLDPAIHLSMAQKLHWFRVLVPATFIEQMPGIRTCRAIAATTHRVDKSGTPDGTLSQSQT